MIQLCRHILPGGKLCDQASVKDTLYCRHHSTVKAALERGQAAPEAGHTPIAFVYPEDRAAIQLNLFLVVQALNQKRIDNATAGTFIRALRACELNLRKGALVEPNRENVAQNVVVLPSGEEVAMPREAMEVFDDPEEEHSLGCLCEDCAGKAGHLPKEQHHAKCRCGACEPSGDAVREAAVLDLHNVPPEPFDWRKAPAWMTAEPHGSAYQDMMIQQCQQKKAMENQRREKAAMEALAAGYEASVDGEVKWKKGMTEALLSDSQQALAEGRPSTSRDLAAIGAEMHAFTFLEHRAPGVARELSNR